jgi:hypothetical protein
LLLRCADTRIMQHVVPPVVVVGTAGAGAPIGRIHRFDRCSLHHD